MAKTRGGARKTTGWGRVLALSLRFQNPAAEPALGATTRARSRRIAAAAAAIPEEILVWEIFVRLTARDILSCRAVCRRWRGLTSAPDFLLAHHRRQPPLLLLTHHGTGPIFKRSHPVLGFEHYDGYTIHASCDGLLLIGRSDGSFSICNRATRQYAPLPRLTNKEGRISTAALYLHRPSGEYRVLYWKGDSTLYGNRKDDILEAAYYIIMLRRRGRLLRRIGVPSDIPGTEKDMLAWNRTNADPVVFRDCLHWDTGRNTGILVFNTVVESFRLMGRPAAATRLCTRLCDMEGSIGFSCFDDGRTGAKIWVLEDYEREVWSFKYHVIFPVSLCNFIHPEHLVLSHNGDVLVYSGSYGCMFCCDSTGKLLEGFCGSRHMRLLGPWFKESLVKHDFFLRLGCASDGRLRFSERVKDDAK